MALVDGVHFTLMSLRYADAEGRTGLARKYKVIKYIRWVGEGSEAILMRRVNIEAIEAIKGGIQLRDDIPQFYAFYASLLDDAKEYQTAVEMLSKAVSKFPTHTQLRFFLGSMHDRVGNPRETIVQMQRVLEIDEKLADVEYVRTSHSKGIMAHNFENNVLRIAIAGTDAVNEGENVFGVTIVVLNSYFHIDPAPTS